MKNFMFTIALVIISLTASAQSKSIEAFYKSHSGDHATVSLNLSGSFLNFLADDEDDNDALKSITSLKILTIEQRNVAEEKFKALTKAVRKEGYEEWMTVKEGSKSEVLFLAKEKNDVITDLVMLVQSDDDYVVMELIGKIDPDKFDDSMNINIDGFEHIKKAKKNKD